MGEYLHLLAATNSLVATSMVSLPPRPLCLQVMNDPMVSKQERKARAQGLRQLGRIFLEVGTAATQGPATRVRDQPAAVIAACLVLCGSHAAACCTSLLMSALGQTLCPGVCASPGRCMPALLILLLWSFLLACKLFLLPACCEQRILHLTSCCLIVSFVMQTADDAKQQMENAMMRVIEKRHAQDDAVYGNGANN